MGQYPHVLENMPNNARAYVATTYHCISQQPPGNFHFRFQIRNPHAHIFHMVTNPHLFDNISNNDLKRPAWNSFLSRRCTVIHHIYVTTAAFRTCRSRFHIKHFASSSLSSKLITLYTYRVLDATHPAKIAKMTSKRVRVVVRERRRRGPMLHCITKM